MLRNHLCLRWSGRFHHLSLILKEVSAPSSIFHGEITPVMPLKCKTFPIYFTFAGNHQYWENAWISSIASRLPGGQGGGGEGDWGWKESGGHSEGRGGGEEEEWGNEMELRLNASFESWGPLCCFSVTKLCPTLCDHMDCIVRGFPVLRYLPEFVQNQTHWVDDAIQPSHPLLPSSPFAFNHSQHQGLFEWVNSSHQMAKVLELQLQCQSF